MASEPAALVQTCLHFVMTFSECKRGLVVPACAVDCMVGRVPDMRPPGGSIPLRLIPGLQLSIGFEPPIRVWGLLCTRHTSKYRIRSKHTQEIKEKANTTQKW